MQQLKENHGFHIKKDQYRHKDKQENLTKWKQQSLILDQGLDKQTKRIKQKQQNHNNHKLNINDIYMLSTLNQQSSQLIIQQQSLIQLSISSQQLYTNRIFPYQQSIPFYQRHIILDWIIDLSEQFQLTSQSYQLTQMILDVVLFLDTSQCITVENLQLCGLCVFGLVTKYLNKPIYIKDLLEMVGNEQEMIRMERYILLLIAFDLSGFVTCYELLDVCGIHIEEREKNFIMYVCELLALWEDPYNLKTYGMFMNNLFIIQSVLYFVFMVKASGTLNQTILDQILAINTNVSQHSLVLKAKQIIQIFQSINQDPKFQRNNAIFNKYNKEKYFYISQNSYEYFETNKN